MADLVWADVVAIAPELATGVSLAAQTMILGMTNESVNPSEFGGETAQTFLLARALYAAHFGTRTVAGTSGASGPVTSQSEGDISESFGNVFASGSNPLNTTTYGQLFLDLVRVSPARAGFTT